MKTEIRERQRTEHYDVYIADDGTEFTSRSKCESYEFQQEKDKRQMTSIPCRTIDEDMPAELWYIRTEEEYKWLKKTAWAHTYVGVDFSGEGWYIAWFEDGGDGPYDETEVLKLDYYLEEYQTKIDELKHLTSFENMI